MAKKANIYLRAAERMAQEALDRPHTREDGACCMLNQLAPVRGWPVGDVWAPAARAFIGAFAPDIPLARQREETLRGEINAFAARLRG